MRTALELIKSSLRLINQPGRGAALAAEDQTQAFESLQEILDSEAVTKQFVPGIRRHYFPFVNAKSIYSYGANPGDELDSSAFGDLYGDPAPIAIEYGQVLANSSILNNEIIDEYRFRNVGTWVVDAAAALANNEYRVEVPGVVTSTTQVPATPNAAPVPGETYTLRVLIEVNAGEAIINLRDSAVAFESYTLDASGAYEIDFVWGTVVAPDIEIETTDIAADFSMTLLSILPRGADRITVPDNQGSYYAMTEIDQINYNRRFTKATLGRPYYYLYTRDAGQAGEIRFDNQGVTGDILVLDVLVNKVQLNNINDTLRVNPQAIKWLRYALADHVSGEYGKELSPRQITIMDNAWSLLAAGNRRINMLGVQRGLRMNPRRFDINRGDP